MAKTLTRVPDKINAGDSVEFILTESDYPASDSWEVTLVLINKDSKETFTSSADGDDHKFTLLPADTQDIKPGEYYWKTFVADGTDRFNTGEGRLEVVPDISSDDIKSRDLRSHVKKVLDAINAKLEGKASEDELSLSIDGQSLSRFSHSQLLDFKSEYEEMYSVELRNERRNQGRNTRKTRKIRFTDN